MELVVGAVVTTACVAAGFVALRGAGAAAAMMSQMFASPAELGWPHGVQEDDDFRWRWSGGPAVQVENGAEDISSPPEIVDLTDGSGPRALPITRH
jgi:hypothetical protein